MQHLPVLTGIVALVMSTVALCLRTQLLSRRSFAGLVATAVTLSLFSLFAWAASIIRTPPSPVVWCVVCALAVLFALKLYRELQAPRSGEGT